MISHKPKAIVSIKSDFYCQAGTPEQGGLRGKGRQQGHDTFTY